MAFFNTLGAFILVLGIIIFVHEFGHFITAKAFGMRVFIFSFGFGKRLLGFKKGDTDYRISLIPLGGYVKLEGEPEDHLSEDTSALGDAKDFTSRPRWQRFLVYLAGPMMNAALTIGVLTVFHMIGFGVDAAVYDPPIIGAVEAGSPAEQAGLQPADRILAIDGRRLDSWEDVEYNVVIRPDSDLRLGIRRGEEERELAVRTTSTGQEQRGKLGVTPLVRVGSLSPGAPAEQAGIRPNDGILSIGGTPIRSFSDIPPIVQAAEGKPLHLVLWRDGAILELDVTPRNMGSGPMLGVGPKTVIKKFGFFRAVKESSVATWDMTIKTFDVLKRLVTAQISPKTMMGPLGIARASGDAAKGGPGQLFFLVAMISLQVGILNLFPLAPLDGGHLAIIAVEGLVRRDFSMNVKAWFMNAGAIVLLGLIVLVVYSDLSKTSWLGKYLP